MTTTFTAVFEALPINARKSALKSLTGSLNSSIIGYVRTHIRQSRYENVSREPSAPTIDTFNDAMSQIDERVADQRALNDMGLAQQVPAISTAHSLELVRNFCVMQLADIARTPNDTPLSIDDTLNFQLSREPNINEPALKALAAALDLDVDALKAAKVKMFNDDRTELVDMRDQIADIVREFDIDGCEDEEHVEAAFAALPAQLQYKLMATLTTSLKKSSERALQDLLRFNRIAAAGDIQLIKAVCKEINAWGRNFAVSHSVELDAFIERGGQLAEMATL